MCMPGCAGQGGRCRGGSNILGEESNRGASIGGGISARRNGRGVVGHGSVLCVPGPVGQGGRCRGGQCIRRASCLP